MKDLQTRKKRLTKTKVSDHFKPELDSNDSFIELPLAEQAKCSGWAILALAVLWVLLVIWGSF
jgi:hypothetical protein